jgi:hypothetical protein
MFALVFVGVLCRQWPLRRADLSFRGVLVSLYVELHVF